MSGASQRVHPLDALAEAMIAVVYRESRRGAVRSWERERARLDALEEKHGEGGPGPAGRGARLRMS